MRKAGGSFRDSSGYVYLDGEKVLRTITLDFQKHWLKATESGFMRNLVDAGDLVAFSEEQPAYGSWKTLQVEKIPFISYPYEWCFSQLRDAARLTLSLHKKALAKGMSLKDASAYNVQFKGVKPVFIDLLSFEERTEGEPWSAYRQFCMHFLAPLALTSYVDLRCGALSRLWIEGVPLDLAARMLPRRTRLRLGLLWHLHLHAGMERKHGDTRKSAQKANAVKVSTTTLSGIADHLDATVSKLRLPGMKTEWGDYYEDTNYSETGAAFKAEYVAKVAQGNAVATGLAVDMGANTGVYSRLLSAHFATVIAADVDPLAVERHYLALRKKGPANILPLIFDIANPTPSLGWACAERDSFDYRCQADFVTALALIHHIRITMGVPLDLAADYFARLVRPGGKLLLEFVPRKDSQVERLLAVREDVFSDYTLDVMRDAFSRHFTEVEFERVPDSLRTLHLFKRV